MASLIILAPIAASSVAISRGAGGDRLLTSDPKEAWFDSAVGSAVTLTLDLGSVQSVDSLFLGSSNAADAATWAISSGVAAPTETSWIAATRMSAPYRRIGKPRMSFFRRGSIVAGAFVTAPISARYIRATLIQPAGSPPLTIGNMAAGLAFQPLYGNEYGSGRATIDTGNREGLVGGGFGALIGVRKKAWSGQLGDLLDAEVDRLDDIFEDKGSTIPIVFIEGTEEIASVPQQEQIHWGLFQKLEAYERQAPAVTRWAISIEEWR
jgi:hypothetical protein